MTDEELKESLASVRKTFIEQLAKDLHNIQPMQSTVISDMYKKAKSEKELIEEGYEPICPLTRIMWRNKQ
jgi:hypothetical protein